MKGLQTEHIRKKNFAETKHFSQLNGLEVLKGAFTTNFFKPHFHETYSIIIINNGIGDYSYKRNKYIVPSGKLLLLNPYDVHTGKSIGKDIWRFRSLYIPTHFVKETFQHTHTKNLRAGIVQDDLFISKAAQIHQRLMDKSNLIEVESLLIAFLSETFKRYGQQKDLPPANISKSVNKIKLVKEYLHDNYQKEISLEDLSKIFQISRFHLIKSFNQQYNLPPHKYLINLRIEKSKQLLKQKSLVTQVAYETGFFDQSHFINSFKNLVGITPKRYAASF